MPPFQLDAGTSGRSGTASLTTRGSDGLFSVSVFLPVDGSGFTMNLGRSRGAAFLAAGLLMLLLLHLSCKRHEASQSSKGSLLGRSP